MSKLYGKMLSPKHEIFKLRDRWVLWCPSKRAFSSHETFYQVLGVYDWNHLMLSCPPHKGDYHVTGAHPGTYYR